MGGPLGSSYGQNLNQEGKTMVNVSGMLKMWLAVETTKARTVVVMLDEEPRGWCWPQMVRGLAVVASVLLALPAAAQSTTNCKQMGTWAVTCSGTATVSGSVLVGGTAAHAGVAPQNPVPVGHYVESDAAALGSTSVVEGDVTHSKADIEGRQFVRTDHPNRVACALTTTATGSTAITGCAAPGAGLSIYITDISIYGGVAVGATAAATIQWGTGGSCGSGTTVTYYCQHGATDGCEAHFTTPRKAAANSEICILDATVGTKFVTISGHVAP